MSNNTAKYREAADKVWKMAKEYEKKGYKELAHAIQELAVQLHDLARSKELSDDDRMED